MDEVESVGSILPPLTLELQNISPKTEFSQLSVLEEKEISPNISQKVYNISEVISSLYFDSKINPFSSLTSNFMRKKNELIYLERLLTKLKNIQDLKKTLQVQLTKLSLNSKFHLPHPPYELPDHLKIDFHGTDSLIDQNAADSHEKTGFNFEYQFYPLLKSLDLKENDSLYKVYKARMGHLLGINKNVLIALSHENIFIIDIIPKKVSHLILYEEITTVIIGAFNRWVYLVCHQPILPHKLSKCVEIEFENCDITLQIMQYLEVAVRRRLIKLQTVSTSSKESDPHVIYPTKYLLSLENELALDNKFHKPTGTIIFPSSIGRNLEPLLPFIVSYCSQELRYIQRCIKEQQNLKELPLIVGCWLVLWQSSSNFWRENHSPNINLEGHLMVFNSLHGSSWTPGYFITKYGILYQFHNQCDRLPQHVIKLNEFCGCQRLPLESRPHSFELIRKNGYILKFAAPNEESASLWLQSFLAQMIFRCDGSENATEEFIPYQLFLTDQHIILSHQKSLFKESQLSKLESAEAPCWDNRVLSEDKVSNICVSYEEKNLSHPRETVENSCSSSATSSRSVSVDSHCILDHKYQNEIFKILSFCTINQIAEIFYLSMENTSCFVELECNEATEMGGDWVLNFSSSTQLKDFLQKVVPTEESSCLNSPILKQVSTGRMSSLLTENAEYAKKFWKPFL